jgi:hypothetical protein
LFPSEVLQNIVTHPLTQVESISVPTTCSPMGCHLCTCMHLCVGKCMFACMHRIHKSVHVPLCFWVLKCACRC